MSKGILTVLDIKGGFLIGFWHGPVKNRFLTIEKPALTQAIHDSSNQSKWQCYSVDSRIEISARKYEWDWWILFSKLSQDRQTRQ